MFCLPVLGLLVLSSAVEVINLHDGNFDDTLSNGQEVLVHFHSPNMGELALTFLRVSEAVTESGLVMAHVNTAENPTITRTHGVSISPLIRLYKSSTVFVDYKGDPTVSGIESWLRTASSVYRLEYSPSYVKKQVVPMNSLLANHGISILCTVVCLGLLHGVISGLFLVLSLWDKKPTEEA